MARKGIQPDTLYIVHGDVHGELSYAVTPDGVGMFWYDTKEEAIEQGDLPEVYATVRITESALEEMRGESDYGY